MAEISERRRLAAILFMTAGMTTFDAYSTLNSSPWTAENFGADPVKVASLAEYVRHAVIFSTAYALAGSIIDGSPLPILGTSIANLYLVWLYKRAVVRGFVAGSDRWQTGEK